MSIPHNNNNKSTGETPFSLVYGVEALILVVIGKSSTRFNQTSEDCNDEEIQINLDLLEGRREFALIRMATQKQVIERYYNQKSRLRFFKIRNFVLNFFFNVEKPPMQGNYVQLGKDPTEFMVSQVKEHMNWK